MRNQYGWGLLIKFQIRFLNEHLIFTHLARLNLWETFSRFASVSNFATIRHGQGRSRRQWLWRLLQSVMWRHAVWYKFMRFRRTAGIILPDYTASHYKRQYSFFVFSLPSEAKSTAFGCTFCILLFNSVSYVLLLFCLCILIDKYALFCILFANWHSPAALTEAFPCFILSCKANARVYLAKTGHGPHSS